MQSWSKRSRPTGILPLADFSWANFAMDFTIFVMLSSVLDLDIYSLHIRSDIKLRYATTLITSRVVNRSPNVSYEAVFDVTLPNQAMISNFTMEIDGVIYPGQVKEKEAAQKQYDKAKKKGQSAGQVKARPRETNKFSVNVNVAAQGKISFNLTYQELLERKKGLYQHVMYINPGQPVKDFKIDVSISESRHITRVIVPPITDDLITNTLTTEETNAEARVIRPNSKSAYIQYHPTLDKQKETDPSRGLSGLFRVFYDVERSTTGGEILAVNGYFVHFFAPEGLETVSKNVLFIIDVSGSMTGEKIKQVKQAMTKILKDMHEGDWFSIMRFSSFANTWPPGFVKVNKKNIARGLEHVEKTKAGGWTNINMALLDGIEQLKALEGNRAGLIVFLTDGEPSKGETVPKNILKNVRDANEGAQIYSLAFGRGADYDFVKKVAAQNYGVGRKIYEDSDADLQIAGFYDDISSAVLQNVQFQYIGDEIDNETTTQSNLKSFFNGSEFIVAGKLKDLSVNSLSTQILAEGSGGSVQLSIETPITEVEVDESVGDLTKLEDLIKITEKIWAYLTIKQLLKKELQEITEDERKEIRAQILEKALKYNFVTPVTSMVVTKPEKSDITDLEGEDKLDDIKRASGGASAASRPSQGQASRYGGGADPHFQVWFNGISEPICFSVRVEENEVYRLVEDEESGHIELMTGLRINTVRLAGESHRAMTSPCQLSTGTVHDYTTHCTETPHQYRLDWLKTFTPQNAVRLSKQRPHAPTLAIAGLKINARIVKGNKMIRPKVPKTYIGTIFVKWRREELLISPHRILINGEQKEWNHETKYHSKELAFTVSRGGTILNIHLVDNIRLEVQRVVHSNGHVDFLNFMVDDETRLSATTGGLVGQFIHTTAFLMKPEDKEDRTHRNLTVFSNNESRQMTVELVVQKKVLRHTYRPCWYIEHPENTILDSDAKTHRISDLFA